MVLNQTQEFRSMIGNVGTRNQIISGFTLKHGLCVSFRASSFFSKTYFVIRLLHQDIFMILT